MHFTCSVVKLTSEQLEGLDSLVVTKLKTLSTDCGLSHLGQSQSGRSRGWSPHCPCVSSLPLPGCSGLQHCCLPSAAPTGAGGASAHAPETPAGTGSSCPPLQVSDKGRERRETAERLIVCPRNQGQARMCK